MSWCPIHLFCLLVCTFFLNISLIYIIILTPVPQSQCINNRDMCNVNEYNNKLNVRNYCTQLRIWTKKSENCPTLQNKQLRNVLPCKSTNWELSDPANFTNWEMSGLRIVRISFTFMTKLIYYQSVIHKIIWWLYLKLFTKWTIYNPGVNISRIAPKPRINIERYVGKLIILFPFY